MKKISLLILLALTITVGGVYAAWSYADNTVAVVTNAETAVNVTDPITSTPRGTIAITNMFPTFSINDNNLSDPLAAGDFHPEWDNRIVDGTNNNLTITFTANPGVTTDEDDCIYILIAFTLDGTNTYNDGTRDINIFSIEDKDIDQQIYNLIKGDNVQADDTIFHIGIMKCQIDRDNLAPQTFTEIIKPSHFITDVLNVNSAIYLPQKADYDSYKTAVNANKIYVTVTEIPYELATGAFNGYIITD